MIRVAIADDHPAVRVGLQAALRAEPGLVPVGAAAGPGELEPLLYSAFADESLTVPAIVAGADGIVHKSSAPRELFEAIRQVARGETAMPPVSDRMLRAAADVVDPSDLPILAMLVDRTPPAEIAAALRISRTAVGVRIPAILGRIKAPVPAMAGTPGGSAAA